MIVKFNITAKTPTKDGGIKHHKVQVVYTHVKRKRAKEIKQQHPGALVLKFTADL
jgi:hypothetical protein